MSYKLYYSHSVFPCPNIKATAAYYSTKLGFKPVEYLDDKEPHICLYRDHIEIILTRANGNKVYTNRELYGYGYDAYIITDNQEELQNEFSNAGANIVKPLFSVKYHIQEFVIEDIDGRWLGFGIKE
jgi:catechol 2,3-dioxygenase-like lactoylglutathione lyase family enzyme